MMSALFREEGAELRIDILGEKDVTDFIDTHAAILDSGFAGTPMSDVMRRSLEESDWIFSGMKTFHELNEAFPSLLDENGVRKTFEQFLNDVRAIDRTYNGRWLNAEYNFAQASAEMAGRWEDIVKDGDDYYLQYRTAGDINVRPEHAALEGVTRPVDDPFWKTYYPPNGWNCRCTVAQVLKGRSELTPSDAAFARAKEAFKTEKARKMFSFNPGIERRTFPAYNPYTISKCLTCPKAKLNLVADIPANELCQICDVATYNLPSVPPKVDTYRSEHNGKVLVSPYHGAEEEAENLRMAKRMSDLLHRKIYLLPNLDSNTPRQMELRKKLLPPGVLDKKNPDFYDGIKLYDGKNLYNFLGHSKEEQKKAIYNHIKKAKLQADNFVFDLPDVFEMEYVGEAIKGYLNCANRSHTIIVFHKNAGYVYEK